MLIYLAGVINPKWDWRGRLIRALEENALIDLAFINPTDLENYIEKPLTGQKQCVVNLDLSAVQESDVVLGYYSVGHLPIGTTCELFFARQLHKPVILLYDEPLGLDFHPWVTYLGSYIIPVPERKPWERVDLICARLEKLRFLLKSK